MVAKFDFVPLSVCIAPNRPAFSAIFGVYLRSGICATSLVQAPLLAQLNEVAYGNMRHEC